MPLLLVLGISNIVPAAILKWFSVQCAYDSAVVSLSESYPHRSVQQCTSHDCRPTRARFRYVKPTASRAAKRYDQVRAAALRWFPYLLPCLASDQMLCRSGFKYTCVLDAANCCATILRSASKHEPKPLRQVWLLILDPNRC